eukprot:305331-Prymnesium_polylepis.1
MTWHLCAQRFVRCCLVGTGLSMDSCAIPGYPGIYGVGISWDCVGYDCVNTSDCGSKCSPHFTSFHHMQSA